MFSRQSNGKFGRKSVCRPCRHVYYGYHNWSSSLKRRAALRAKIYNTTHIRPALNRAWRGAISRRPNSNLTFDQVLMLWEKQQGRCALSGIVMKRGKGFNGGPAPLSPSIDRINPHKDYTFSNARLLIYAVNAFRMRMSDQEMVQIAKEIIKHART